MAVSPSHKCWVQTMGCERFQHHHVFFFWLPAICTAYVSMDEVRGGVSRL